jgi:hypothetical protein
MRKANITDKQLVDGNEPQFDTALQARDEVRVHAERDPVAYHAREDAVLAFGRSEAATT